MLFFVLTKDTRNEIWRSVSSNGREFLRRQLLQLVERFD